MRTSFWHTRKVRTRMLWRTSLSSREFWRRRMTAKKATGLKPAPSLRERATKWKLMKADPEPKNMEPDSPLRGWKKTPHCKAGAICPHLAAAVLSWCRRQTC